MTIKERYENMVFQQLTQQGFDINNEVLKNEIQEDINRLSDETMKYRLDLYAAKLMKDPICQSFTFD